MAKLSSVSSEKRISMSMVQSPVPGRWGSLTLNNVEEVKTDIKKEKI